MGANEAFALMAVFAAITIVAAVLLWKSFSREPPHGLTVAAPAAARNATAEAMPSAASALPAQTGLPPPPEAEAGSPAAPPAYPARPACLDLSHAPVPVILGYRPPGKAGPPVVKNPACITALVGERAGGQERWTAIHVRYGRAPVPLESILSAVDPETGEVVADLAGWLKGRAAAVAPPESRPHQERQKGAYEDRAPDSCVVELGHHPRRVWIRYLDSHDTVTERVVAVHRMIGRIAGEEIEWQAVRGHCELRNTTRTFALHYILAAKDAESGESIEDLAEWLRTKGILL